MMQPFDSAEYGVPGGLAPGTTAAGGTDLGAPLSIGPGWLSSEVMISRAV